MVDRLGMSPDDAIASKFWGTPNRVRCGPHYIINGGSPAEMHKVELECHTGSRTIFDGVLLLALNFSRI